MDREWFHTFFEQDYFRKEPGQIGTTVDGSVPQVEFLIDVLHLSPNHRILDLCCGYGRHAINFARRGYDIVAFDLCERALRLAGQVARGENLKIHLVRGDARTLAFKSGFDSAYSLFAFGYFEDDDENLLVLDGVASILISHDQIKVNLNSPIQWQVVGKEIGTAIRSHLITGMPAISEVIWNQLPSDEEIKTRVQQILDSQKSRKRRDS